MDILMPMADMKINTKNLQKCLQQFSLIIKSLAPMKVINIILIFHKNFKKISIDYKTFTKF